MTPEELEAERDEWKARFETECFYRREWAFRAESAEALVNQYKDIIDHINAVNQSNVLDLKNAETERDRLREENEALREEVQSYEFSTAAIAGMLHQNQLDEAWEWANDATSKARLAASSKLALLRTKGDAK